MSQTHCEPNFRSDLFLSCQAHRCAVFIPYNMHPSSTIQQHVHTPIHTSFPNIFVRVGAQSVTDLEILPDCISTELHPWRFELEIFLSRFWAPLQKGASSIETSAGNLSKSCGHPYKHFVDILNHFTSIHYSFTCSRHTSAEFSGIVLSMKNQHIRELISAQKTSHKRHNKDLNRLR